MDKSMIKIGDEVVDIVSGVDGVVIKQYYPTACEQQTMIQCDDGRKYHAPTRCFIKKNYISDSEIDRNPYLNEVGKYATKFARNHGISVSEAMSRSTVKAYAAAHNYLNSLT